jgi:thiamine biosynthesis lipoprotein ApbE
VIARRFRAMGTDVELFVEALLSRFRLDSELSRLNDERTLEPGPDLLEVVELALLARVRTGGRFDPTVHDALVAAGYDRSFELVPADGPAAGSAPCGGGVLVDGRRIELEPDVRLDLGGIGKGFAVERAATWPSAAALGPSASRRRMGRSRSSSTAARSPPRAATAGAGAATATSSTT